MAQMENLYDVVVIGGGPAGLTAALYLARARYRVVVVEKEHFGGQITITSEVVNFPGVERTSGAALTETMRKQARVLRRGISAGGGHRAGCCTGDVKTVRTSRGDLKCFGVLLATGAHPRMVGFQGEEQFRGRGVAYCATCDGEFFTGKDVFVVGGGFAAAEESVFLTKYARHVTILIRGEDFTCAQATADAARNHEKITVLTNTVVEEVSGDTALRFIRYRNTKDRPGDQNTTQRTGRPSAYSSLPDMSRLRNWCRAWRNLNEQGYILTDRSQKTTCGRPVCRRGCVRQATAAGGHRCGRRRSGRHGAGAAVLPPCRHKTGLHPQRAAEPIRRNRRFRCRNRQFTVHWGHARPAPYGVRPDGRAADPAALSGRNAPLRRTAAIYGGTGCPERQAVGGDWRAADDADHLPCVRVCRADGGWTGLAFHGVPGGHEFTSFVLGLYNAAGPGQALDEESRAAIQAIQKQTDLQILVSLSCTMCPDLVTAAQRIAAENPEHHRPGL